MLPDERTDRPTISRLLALEARAHRWPARRLREVAGGILVHDPHDPEPVFNRLVDPMLPRPGDDWDGWLRDIRDAFGAINRRPHVWLTAAVDDPRIDRLERDGFGQVGASRYMSLEDPAAAQVDALALAAPGAEVERLGPQTPDKPRAARDVAAVIADAFDLDPAFHVLIQGDVVEMLEVAAIGFVVARLDGEAVAVARRTSDGAGSLLAAIGTRRDFRGRGLGRLVTATATQDALAAGSSTVFLGVEDGNDAARHLYERLGYVMADGGVTALLER
jgi:ribosomal protein S18 acetylase RimI-like enzyme